MKPEIPLKSGDEYDLFSKYWRHCVSWQKRERAKIKRKYRKRVRRLVKLKLKGETK